MFGNARICQTLVVPLSSKKSTPSPKKPTSLKELAAYLGFSPATVSLVINRSPVANAIPQRTKDQIIAAAKKFNYRPNLLAKSLRTRRSFIVGVIVPEVSEGYEAAVLSGIEDHLLEEDYFYFVASHRHRNDLIEKYAQLFLDRNIDGLIAVDTPWNRKFDPPVVTISGNHSRPGITKVKLDHNKAAELALGHLQQLGHKAIAVIKGQKFSSDTDVRWNSITRAADKLGIKIPAKFVVQLAGASPTPEVGYRATKKLLASTSGGFTALFAFNDISAIGAIQALREAGIRVPEDVSVMGFDDIQSAAYQNPGLTTVRQPLRKMGETAAEILLKRIRKPDMKTPDFIVVEPELVVRGTTAAASGARARSTHYKD